MSFTKILHGAAMSALLASNAQAAAAASPPTFFDLLFAPQAGPTTKPTDGARQAEATHQTLNVYALPADLLRALASVGVGSTDDTDAG